jgi:hypothetical protein
MTKTSVRSLLGMSLGLMLVALGAVPAASTAAPVAAAPPYNCSPNGPAGSQTVYGTFGDAGVIGWAGNSQAVTACLGGSFWVDTSGPNGGPGSASTAAVTGTTYGYGVYDDTPTTWTNADGYLPIVTGVDLPAQVPGRPPGAAETSVRAGFGASRAIALSPQADLPSQARIQGGDHVSRSYGHLTGEQAGDG